MVVGKTPVGEKGYFALIRKLDAASFGGSLKWVLGLEVLENALDAGAEAKIGERYKCDTPRLAKYGTMSAACAKPNSRPSGSAWGPRS